MYEYTIGSGSALKGFYENQNSEGTVNDYVWEFCFDRVKWYVCVYASPNWDYDTDYRFKLKDVDPKDKIISDQADEIIALKEKVEALRLDYKTMVEQNMGLIIDLAPTFSDEQLRMVGGRTGSWFVVLEQTTPLYFIRYDPRTDK